MKSVCIGQSELPSTSRLFADYLSRFPSVASFYHRPPTLDAVRQAASEAQLDLGRRASLVEALARQNAGGGAVQHSLERLARPETVVVASGQQVGLYGGPLFTFYKALTAAKLASRLNEQGVPAVAVFWLATEDHDLAEVDHTWVFDAAGRPLRLQADTAAAPNQPVGSVEIGKAAGDDLRAAMAGFACGADVSDRAGAAWATGATLGGAFARFLGELLAPYGVLLLDPTEPDIRRLTSPFLSEALEAMPDLVGAVRERGERLRAAGYHEQVKVADSASFIFLSENNKRIVLRRSNGRFQGDGRGWSAEELLRLNENGSAALSPNALLRPVMQDYLLPTAAFITGPAELAYLAQSGALYERLLGRMPVFLPRASFTLIDPRTAKLLDRYSLQAQDCWVPAAELERRIAHKLVPQEMSERFATAHEEVDERLEDLAVALGSFDPTLAEAFSRSRKKIAYQIEKTRLKAEREALRRNDRAKAEAAELTARLYPRKSLQERVYSALPFLAQRGPELLDTVYDAIDPEGFCHRILEI